MQRTPGASGEYLRNAVMTATPEQLHLMLYDGAIRFITQAKDALAAKNLEASCEKLIRAQRIVLEMQRGLRPEHNPELCRNLEGLYTFVYNRLVDANISHDAGAMQEALQILEHQRETWRMLIERVQAAREKEGGEAQANQASNAAPRTDDSLPRASISLQC
jgi:flagellar secretion chaperone FliS